MRSGNLPRVGLGWSAPSCIMSRQLRLWSDGSDGAGNGAGGHNPRASLHRELWYLLTINTKTGGVGRVSPSGLAYSLSVCLIEDFNMSRGKSKGGAQGNGSAMPRFVDIKLTQEQKAAFLGQRHTAEELVGFLQAVADDGYRVGCSWNAESQSYTVSMTCRNAESVNNGLCVTSFAKDVSTAIALAWYKHDVVCGGDWLGAAGPGSEDFG